jgi:hypothetical protein
MRLGDSSRRPAALGEQRGLARFDREAVTPDVAQRGHGAGGLVAGIDRGTREDDDQVGAVEQLAQPGLQRARSRYPARAGR